MTVQLSGPTSVDGSDVPQSVATRVTRMSYWPVVTFQRRPMRTALRSPLTTWNVPSPLAEAQGLLIVRPVAVVAEDHAPEVPVRRYSTCSLQVTVMVLPPPPPPSRPCGGGGWREGSSAAVPLVRVAVLPSVSIAP